MLIMRRMTFSLMLLPPGAPVIVGLSQVWPERGSSLRARVFAFLSFYR